EALFSHIRGASIFGNSPFFTLEGGRLALNAETKLAEPVSSLLPASNPYNPYGVDVPIEYTFFDLGQTIKTNRSDAWRIGAGGRGRRAGREWELSAVAALS